MLSLLLDADWPEMKTKCCVDSLIKVNESLRRCRLSAPSPFCFPLTGCDKRLWIFIRQRVNWCHNQKILGQYQMKVKEEIKKKNMPQLFILIPSFCWDALMLSANISNQSVTFDKNNGAVQRHAHCVAGRFQHLWPSSPLLLWHWGVALIWSSALMWTETFLCLWNLHQSGLIIFRHSIDS